MTERESTVRAGAREGEALPEGEERAPPGTRAAAMVRWALVALVAIAAAATWGWHLASGGAGHAAGMRYRCPMHPTIVTERKAECPICGMDLVATDAPAAAQADHGAVGAGHGAAAGEHAAKPAPAKAGPRYTCPMHPEFVVDDPKARCPDCGMKLSPLDADVAPEPAPATAGVPGLAPVELTADRIQLVGMKTASAVREPLAATVRTTGFVTTTEKGLVSVNARLAGWIESLGAADTGQLVEAGQVLAVLYGADIAGAQQQFLATARWSEVRGAAAGGTGGPPDAARQARQRLELLGMSPEDVDALAASGKPGTTLNVRAPVRGHIARKSAVRGAYVQPGVELFQLADLSTVWVLADVHEADLGRVKVGQKASLELAAYPGESFTGKVTFVYPAVAAGSRTLRARVELRNPGLRLRPGMVGDVTLELGAAEAVVIPSEALVDTGELQYVFVSRGAGRFEPRRVRAGWSGDGKVAVLEGLAAGERVVTTANFLLDSESRLRAAVEGFEAP
jgi:Cu(I)/Ag(I) efflux system membrane fusion protein